MNNALIEMPPIAAAATQTLSPFMPNVSTKDFHDALCLCVQALCVNVSVCMKIQTEKWNGFNSELYVIHGDRPLRLEKKRECLHSRVSQTLNDL